jgi:hypothetical protein
VLASHSCRLIKHSYTSFPFIFILNHPHFFYHNLDVVLRGIAELEQKLGRDLVGNGMLINFQKKYMQGEILVNLQRFNYSEIRSVVIHAQQTMTILFFVYQIHRMQSIPYNFLPVEVIQKYLKKTSFTTSQTSELSSSLRYSEPSIDRAIKELMATDPDFKAKVRTHF